MQRGWVHIDELLSIFENSKESLLRSETLDAALEQTSKWNEEYKKINEYWKKEYPPKRLEEETVEDSLYDIYICRLISSPGNGCCGYCNLNTIKG